MKLSYLTTAMLAMGLTTGCINVRVGCDCKPKHHQGKESGDREEEKEEHESKHHEGKESEDREDEKEDHDGKEKKGHKESDKEEAEEKEEKGGKDSKAKLQAMAKISESKARQIAMEQVPNGTIKEGELEKENGKLQWSFDMSTPGAKEITEVNIDAITGTVIAVAKESAENEAKEEKKEKDDK